MPTTANNEPIAYLVMVPPRMEPNQSNKSLRSDNSSKGAVIHTPARTSQHAAPVKDLRVTLHTTRTPVSLAASRDRCFLRAFSHFPRQPNFDDGSAGHSSST